MSSSRSEGTNIDLLHQFLMHFSLYIQSCILVHKVIFKLIHVCANQTSNGWANW